MTVRNEFGLSEFVEGTLIHPIWSVDRNDWVSISDLEPGERLQGAEGILYVESIDLVRRNVSVYNIEVHGEHVYQVGELGLLVHNSCVSRISESTMLVREAERTGRRFQDSINSMFKKLWDGNLNPGIGTKPIGAGISEARSADGARIYFRQLANGIVEILGKSDKSNQSKVIGEVLRVFGN